LTGLSVAPEPEPAQFRPRRPTTTARFGSSRRESHDASAYYERFVAPEISDDAEVRPPIERDVIHHHDARDMEAVATASVALVVTSPPYFAGKEYEESLGRDGAPATYAEYLALLGDVFAECRRVLEPGGRIAVNVANLGRRPYRSLAGDVTDILQPSASSSPARVASTGPSAPAGATSRAFRRGPPSRGTSSSRPRPTCGSWPPNGPPGWATRPRSR
jgi:hypothetical protein